MKKTLIGCLAFMLCASTLSAQSYKFDFTTGKKVKEGYTKITPADRYSDEKGYGYDLQASPDEKSNAPFFFSVNVPDGNYHVTAVIGNRIKEYRKERKLTQDDLAKAVEVTRQTIISLETRRLFAEEIHTKKKETKVYEFTINKRNVHISDKEDVRIKARERSKLNWDDKLTLEFNGSASGAG